MAGVSVVLPTYNERENIADLLDSIKGQGDFEIVVVDDSSPDGTWEIVGELEEKDKSIRLIKRDGKRGVASAISDGISASKGDIVVWMDSDFSMSPDTIPEMLDAIKDSDIVVASRYARGSRDMRHFSRSLSSRLFNLYAAALLGWSTRDYTSGFIAARREVFERVRISRKGHGEYTISFLHGAKRAGFRVREIPHTCSPRRAGKTKTFPGIWSVFRHAFAYLATPLRLRLGIS